MATSPSFHSRKRIQVQGVVQGVGFRPFVYTVADALGLTGHVFNSSAGVTIEIEGGESSLNEFLAKLRSEPPHLAEIAEITVSEMDARGTAGFTILHSRHEGGESALVPFDAGTCNLCWRDFSDPLNRRHGYAFTNCTHCGPRYTIIKDIPYDRVSTTMSSFTMCSACAREYSDPCDRRFHAQPNACPLCGPSLVLVPRGTPLSECNFRTENSLPAIQTARQLLKDGKILAVKGLGGFLLACDPNNEEAVRQLRHRKGRPDKPFALMSRDIASVRRLCAVSDDDQVALLQHRRPVVILPRLTDGPPYVGVAPGNDTLGVMLPYTPLHYLLFSDSIESESAFDSLVMTSGNRSEEPILISNDEALRGLVDVADWFLLHNRNIATRVDDSVVRTFEGRQRVLRRSRGFVPQAIDVGLEMAEVLAMGSDSKNTFCLTKGRYAVLSQHIGDLENYETIRFFDETLAAMKHLLKIAPRAVAHELHPSSMSALMAQTSLVPHKIAVQHHHAHIASCMAENGLQSKVIGVALDGTGFGPDGKVWGGEFMIADFKGFERRAHLRYVPLPGENLAVRQPWRMALSYLQDAFGSGAYRDLRCFRSIPQAEFETVEAALCHDSQLLEASSCGRLFDAVAALTGLGTHVTFEGQVAIALETAALHGEDGCYGFDIAEGEPAVVDFRSTIRAIVNDLANGCSIGIISARFHTTLASAIVEMCCRLRFAEGLSRVCLSGGTFQNLRLLDLAANGLRRRGFDVFLHALVPANDGGVSLGQAIIANELLRDGLA